MNTESGASEAGRVDRRRLLTGTMAAACMAGTGLTTQPATASTGKSRRAAQFGYCLNTSTIRGQELGIAEEVQITAEAGYDGIEPWIRELDAYEEAGGKLDDLAAQIQDAGLTVASAIGFAAWIVDDPAQRRAALDQARREMDKVRRIGGTRIAAPPAGIPRGETVDLLAAADRYHDLLEVGREQGVMPQLEVWGFSSTLGRLGEAVMVAIESGGPDGRLLLDVYHVFKGGSDLSGIRWLRGETMDVFHLNDYPAAPPREEMNDAHRVYPGDGVAPLTELIQNLDTIGFQGMLSVELFNRDYWQQDARQVARTALEKSRAVVESALNEQNTSS